ncbi:MAG: glycosyltransferase family 2 protein [Sphingobium sp.]
MPGSALQLAVVVPVLNEAGNIERLFAALTQALSSLCWEVIFVDDGSRDGTIALIDNLALRHRHVHAIKRVYRTGLSSAVVEGAMSSSAPVIAVIDGDMQHDERCLPAMYRQIAEGGADMVVGTRYAEGGTADGLSDVRLRGSRFVTRLSNMLLRTQCSDPMSGFFAIRRDRLVEICPRLSAMGFKIVLDILASSRGKLRVSEQPFHFRDRQAGDSKMSARVVLDLLIFLIDKTAGRVLPTRLLLFMMVGSLGVLVHLSVLRAVLGLGQGFEVAQTAAVLVAIAFNFTLNNVVTFADRRLRGIAVLKGLLSFYLVCGTGAVANIGVGTLVFAQDATWWLAGIAGATVGAVWNYAASSLLTWRAR